MSHFLQGVLLLCFSAPLLVWGYLGHFSRYIADDYCLAGRVLAEGFFGSMLWWYNNWSGRFAYWIFIAVSGATDPRLAAILPALILILWFIGLVWVVYEMGLAMRVRQPLYGAFLLAAVILFATLEGAPSMLQSLYWLGSTIPYTLPLIPFTFYFGLFLFTLRRKPTGGRPSLAVMVVMALITFFAGGLCEVHAAFQFTALGMVGAAIYRYAPKDVRRTAFPMLAVGMVSSLLALVIIAVAPGNAIRQLQFTHQFSAPELVVRTVLYSAGYMVLALGRFSPLALFLTVVISAGVVYYAQPITVELTRKRNRELTGLSLVSVWILTMASLVLPLYGLGMAPSSRVYLTPQFALVWTAALWGALIGVGLRSQFAPWQKALGLAALVVLLLAGPLASAWQGLTQIPDFQTFAAEWDQRDRDLRAAVARGERRIETRMLTVDIGARAGLDTMVRNPQDWVNGCAAMYYGLEAISARPLLQMGDKTVDA
jgi:hypothetical protein